MNLQTRYEAAQDYAQAAAEAADEHYQDVLTQVEDLRVWQLAQRLPQPLKARLADILEDYALHLIREGDD